MIQRPFFVFCLIFILSGFAAAQRTVTNADLEKYVQARLLADRDYRENYQRLGLPSPEELEKRREASRVETDRLYEKLRAERLEAARISAIQAEADARLASSTQFVPLVVPYNVPVYGFYSGGFYSGRRYSRFNRGGSINLGYVGGGQFWPSGIRTAPRPILWGKPARPVHQGIRRTTR